MNTPLLAALVAELTSITTTAADAPGGINRNQTNLKETKHADAPTLDGALARQERALHELHERLSMLFGVLDSVLTPPMPENGCDPVGGLMATGLSPSPAVAAVDENTQQINAAQDRINQILVRVQLLPR